MGTLKILITTDTYAPTINGVVTSIQNLTRALTNLGHEVRILTLAHDADSTGYREGVYYLRSFKCGIYPDARITVAFRDPLLREIEDWEPDIIHSQTEFSSLLFAKHLSKKLDIPLVHTYHTLYEDYTHYFCPNQVLGTLAVRRLTRLLTRSASLLVAPSVKVRDTLLRYGVQAPVAVIPTGIDLTRFRAPLADDARAALRRSLSLPENCQVLLALGRVAEEKNLGGLLDMIAPVLRARQDAYFVVVGDGPYRETLETRVAALGLTDKVRFTGMVEAVLVPVYYRLGDVFVCASSSETQGLTYLEAMACGLPQVVRHDECLRGVVQNGKNGYQFTTPEECAAHLDRLLGDETLRGRMAAHAAEYSARFSMEAFGEHAAACYEALTEPQLLMQPVVLQQAR